MDSYNVLSDGDSTSTIEIGYDSTSEIYLTSIFPDEKLTNLVKLYVAEDNVRIYYSYSVNNVDWTYLAATTGDHAVVTGILTEYSDSTSAAAAYIELDAGQNVLQTPDNIQIKYGRVHFISPSGSLTATLSQYVWSEVISFDDITAGTINTGFVTITSPDGKMVITGNSMTCKDGSGVTRAIFGELP
jgi:hypothetical protein